MGELKLLTAVGAKHNSASSVGFCFRELSLAVCTAPGSENGLVMMREIGFYRHGAGRSVPDSSSGWGKDKPALVLPAPDTNQSLLVTLAASLWMYWENWCGAFTLWIPCWFVDPADSNPELTPVPGVQAAGECQTSPQRTTKPGLKHRSRN